MSDTETTVDDVTTDVDTEIDTTDEPAEISYEQALEWKKKAERLEKAEKSLVEYKKKAKELEKTSEPEKKYLTEADLERRDFLKANPELAEYTKEFDEKVAKGYTYEDAKLSVLNSDTARKNREKVNSLGLSDGEPTKERSTITKAELAKIAEKDPKEYNRLRDLMDAGKLSMK